MPERVNADRAIQGLQLDLGGFHCGHPVVGAVLVLIASVLTVTVDNWERLQKVNNAI